MTNQTRNRLIRAIDRLAIVMLAVGLAAAPTHATRMTFDPVDLNFQPVDQDYGDRVMMSPQDGFEYGSEGGFTPNVEVSYGPHGGLPSLWTRGYGDLVNVLFDNNDSFGILEVTWTADPGWEVVIHSMEVAAYSEIDPIDGLSVRSGTGIPLFELSNVTIPVDGHTTYTFDPPLSAPVVRLRLSSGNLGILSDNVAVDNIVFSQERVLLPVEEATWSGIKERYR